MKLEADLGWDKWYKLEVAKPVRKRLHRAIARGRRTTSGMPTAVTDCRLFGRALCRPESKSCRTRGREILTVYSITALNLAGILFGGWNARKVVSHPTILLALAAATTLKKAWNTFSNWQNDDQVGHIVPAAAVGASYTDATDAIVHKDGSVRGRVKLVLVQ